MRATAFERFSVLVQVRSSVVRNISAFQLSLHPSLGDLPCMILANSESYNIPAKSKNSSIAASLLPTASPESLVSSAPQPETLSQYLAFQVSSACACIYVPDVATSTSTAVSPLAFSPLSRSRKGLSLELGVGLLAAFMLISGAVGFILYQRRMQRQRMNLKNEPAGISTRNSGSQNPQSQNQWLPELDARDHILEADGGITNELGAGSGTYEYS